MDHAPHTSPPATTETQPLDDRDLSHIVRRTARRLHRNALVTGAAVVVLAAASWAALAVLVDLILPLSVGLRVTAWVGFWIILLFAAGLGLAWPLLRRPTAAQVALRIERAMGGMHNRLLTVLDLREDHPGRRTLNRGFLERLLHQTRQRLTGYRVEHVADPRPMQRSLAGLGIVAAVLILLAAVFADRLPTAAARLAMPTANIPPATYLQLETPGDGEVLHGESLTLSASITRGEASQATLHYRPGDGDWMRYPMSRDGEGGFTFTLSSVTDDAHYFVSAGRTWTPTHTIAAVPRPVIEQLHATVHLPEYLALPEPHEIELDDRQLTAVEGSAIELAAEVTGETTRGELVLLDAETTTREQTSEEERVWLDDHLPDDADTTGRWRWSTARARSGVRSHTFGWDAEPYSFRTRLDPLRLGDDDAFFLYVHPDPDQPPARLTLTLILPDDEQARFTWGEPPESADAQPPRHMGELPAAGEWSRLTVNRRDLPEPFGQADRIVGLGFAIDAGRAFFDRAGSLRRQTESQQVTTYDERDTRPLTFDADRNRWVGRFTLTEDQHFTVRMFNGLDHPSEAGRPIRAVARADEPPRVRVDRPGRDVTLDQPRPLSVDVRGIDDFGIAQLGIQFGRSPEELGEVQSVAEFDAPRRARTHTATIPADHLQPGRPLHYRLTATDRKGQTAHSETYRAALVDDDGPPPDDLIERPPTLDDMLDGLTDLLDGPLDLTEALEDLAANLPEEVREQLPELDGMTWRDAEGDAMSDEEVSELFEQLYGDLDEDQQQQLQDFDETLEQRQQRMEEIAEQLREAAEQAAESPLSMPGEQEALEMAASEMDRLAEQARPETATEGDPAALEQFAQSQGEQADEDDESVEQLNEDLTQLNEAREQADDDPEAARAQAQAARARMQARQTMESIASLQSAMQQMQQQLDAMRSEQDELTARSDGATEEQLEDLAERQDVLEERAADQLDQADRILGEDEAAAADADAADTDPPEDSPTDSPEPTSEPTGEGGPEADPAGDEPPASEQTDGTSSDETPSADALRQRQQQTREQLDAGRESVAETRREGQEAGDEIRSQLSQLDLAQQQLDNARAQQEESADAAESSSSQQAQQATQKLSESTESLDQLLDSPRMQRLKEMADRASPGSEQSQQDSQQQGAQQPATQAGFMSEEEINLMLMEEAIAPPGEQGGGYRLQPQARQSLLQGMREQGPEGYQSLIDAYYRELSREVE